MTTRPLLRHTIVQLEEMFAAQPSDADILKSLNAELQFRNVPRATALLRKVKSVLRGGSPMVPSVQPELITSAQTPAHPTAPPAMPPPSVILPKAIAKPTLSPAETPSMPLDEAYTVLRVTAGTIWAEVEQSRSKIVQCSNPDNIAGMSAEKRLAVQTDAKRANVAYSVILQSRSG